MVVFLSPKEAAALYLLGKIAAVLSVKYYT